MIPGELIPVFRKNFLVCGLPDSVVDQIAAIAEFGVTAAAEPLLARGHKSSDLYVILEGKVNILSAQGDKLADAGPGSVIGEVALVDDQPR